MRYSHTLIVCTVSSCCVFCEFLISTIEWNFCKFCVVNQFFYQQKRRQHRKKVWRKVRKRRKKERRKSKCNQEIYRLILMSVVAVCVLEIKLNELKCWTVWLFELAREKKRKVSSDNNVERIRISAIISTENNRCSSLAFASVWARLFVHGAIKPKTPDEQKHRKFRPPIVVHHEHTYMQHMLG